MPHQLNYRSAAPNIDPTIKRRRITFVICTWTFGISAIQSIPVYPWFPESWAKKGFPHGIHWAWLAPFCCGIASMATAVLLFRLPKLADKIGAILSILFCGLWPTLLAINWWLYFL
jgi:hypothetical protein